MLRNKIQGMIIFCVAVNVIYSCGNSSHADRVNGNPVVPEVDQVLSESDQKILELVNQARKILETIDCEKKPDDPLCQETVVRFEEPDDSYDETILIIDTIPEFSLLTRYKNRASGFYRLNEDSLLDSYSPEYTIPKFIDDVLALFSGDTVIPAKKINDLSLLESERSVYELMHEKAEPYLSRYILAGHGKLPLSIILEYNPETNIIVMQSFTEQIFYRNKAMVCDKNFDVLTAIFNENILRLKGIIDEKNVQYINYSAGATKDTITSVIDSCGCDTTFTSNDYDTLFELYNGFYDVLFNSEGVIGIQAAAVGTNGDRECYKYDFMDYNNRIRAGYFTELDSNLDPYGKRVDADGGYPTIPPGQKNSTEVIDILLNTGVENDRPFDYNDTPLMESDIYGFDFFPINGSYTSWIAPLALSWVRYLRHSEFADYDLNDDTIRMIRERIAPEGCPWQDDDICRMQDPLRYGQMEVFRLGYLDSPLSVK